MKDHLECPKCHATTEAKCGCGVGYIFVAASKVAADAIKANPEKSDRMIAEEIGVSAPTVSKARKTTVNNFTVEKRIGKDGKERKMPEPRKVKPRFKLDKVQADVQALVDADQPISRKGLAQKHGTGVHTVQLAHGKAEGIREGRRQVLAELGLDAFPKSAQDKLAAATRLLQKKLDAQFEQRVQADSKRRIDSMVLPAFKEEREDHDLMVKCRKGVFKRDEYNVILRCVHPDLTPTIAEKNEAFQLLHERKLMLLSDKDDPRVYPELPTVDEIMRGRK